MAHSSETPSIFGLAYLQEDSIIYAMPLYSPINEKQLAVFYQEELEEEGRGFSSALYTTPPHSPIHYEHFPSVNQGKWGSDINKLAHFPLVAPIELRERGSLKGYNNFYIFK